MRPDQQAQFEVIFRAEYEPIVRTVYLILKDPGLAEDVTQDAFAQLAVHWRKVSTYERPGAWLRRVAIRRSMRTNRRLHLRVAAEERLGPAEPPPGPETDLLDAIRKLPMIQRAAIVLRYFEGCDNAELADLLDCSPGAARVHLHRARKKLATLLGEVIPDAAR